MAARRTDHREGASDGSVPAFYTNRVQQQFLSRRAARDLTPFARLALFVICTEADLTGNGARPVRLSLAQLADLTGYRKEGTIRAGLKQLEDAGWLVVHRRAGNESSYAVRVPSDEPVSAPQSDGGADLSDPANPPTKPEGVERPTPSQKVPPPKRDPSPSPLPKRDGDPSPSPLPKRDGAHDTRTLIRNPHGHEGEKGSGDGKQSRDGGGWSGGGIAPGEFDDRDGWRSRLAEWLEKFPPPPGAISIARERFLSHWLGIADLRGKLGERRNPGAYLTGCLKKGGPNGKFLPAARRLLYQPAADADGNLPGGGTVAGIGRDPAEGVGAQARTVEEMRVELAKRFPGTVPEEWSS